MIAAAKIDSPKAHETALTKAADYEKKHPGMPISYVLELTSRYPDAAWRVIWGESAGTSDYSILVDASTGVYVETIH